MKYEYGIAHHSMDVSEYVVQDTHRQGMTSQEADNWLQSWKDDGGMEGAFVKIRRPITDWEVVK